VCSSSSGLLGKKLGYFTVALHFDVNSYNLLPQSEHQGPCNKLLCELNKNLIYLNFVSAQHLSFWSASKDNITTLTTMRDFEEQTYVEVYGRPMYFASNMTGKPYGLLRYGYPDEGGTIIDNSTVSLPNQHYHPRHFDDDDFFEVNSATPSF
jgi:hypothetical protein